MLWRPVKTPVDAETLVFRCNVCGGENDLPRTAFSRETGICVHCRSTVRWRAILHILSVELFGESLALPDFPSLPELAGLGLSDWEGYALPLAGKLGYTNTYFDRAPRLDLTAIPPDLEDRFDFVVASDVLEHVAPPVSVAFANLRALLRPGGVSVLTVPYELEGETVEHFPDLHEFELVEREDDGWELRNTTPTGEAQVFRDLVFHGGVGATLEMRVFAQRPFLEELRRAGFGELEFYDTETAGWGIVWVEDRSLPLAARVPAAD